MNNRYYWNNVDPTVFDDNGNYTVHMGWVNAGQRVKVALVRNSTPTKDYTTDPLKRTSTSSCLVQPNAVLRELGQQLSGRGFYRDSLGQLSDQGQELRFDGFNEFFAVAWSLT